MQTIQVIVNLRCHTHKRFQTQQLHQLLAEQEKAPQKSQICMATPSMECKG